MSTKIGIITEGSTDQALLPALLNSIASKRAGYKWPVEPDDLDNTIKMRKCGRGHGGVLEKVRTLITYLNSSPPTDHAFFVVLLDNNTTEVQNEIKQLTQGKPFFIIGIAIEEIEAWWLADKRNLFEFLAIKDEHCSKVRFGRERYCPETDDDPKKTLDELTEISPRLQQTYGKGNTSLARDFADDYWMGRVDLDAIEQNCPKGFAPFCRSITQAFRSEIARQKAQAAPRT